MPKTILHEKYKCVPSDIASETVFEEWCLLRREFNFTETNKLKKKIHKEPKLPQRKLVWELRFQKSFISLVSNIKMF